MAELRAAAQSSRACAVGPVRSGLRHLTNSKTDYTKKYGITARQFNAIYIQLKGKVQSIIELHKVHLTELRDKLKSLKKLIAKQIEKAAKLHEKIIRLEKKLGQSIPCELGG